jgi:hypothetical protein
MISSVYLSGGSLDVVTGVFRAGCYRIRAYHSFKIPEGLLARGVICDIPAFSAFLDRLWEENSLPRTGLSLVIGGGPFLSRSFMLPLFSKAGSPEHLRHEFSEAQHIDELLIQRLKLSFNLSGCKRSMLGIAAEKSYISDFYEAFTRAGLSLVAIDSDLSALIRLLRRHPQIKRRSLIILLRSGSELRSFIFINGVYLYSERLMLSSEEGSDRLVSALLRIISALIQFLRVEKQEHRLSGVLLSGFDYELLPQLEESLNQLYSGLSTEKLSTGPCIQVSSDIKAAEELIFPASGLSLMPGKTGFLSSFIITADKEAAFKLFSLRQLLPFIVIIILLLSWWYSLFNQRLLLMERVSKLSYLLSETQLSQAADLYDKYELKLSEAQSLYAAAQKANLALSTYPLFNSRAALSIEATAKAFPQTVSVSVVSYEAETGCVCLDCSARDEWLVHQFIRRLKYNSLLKSVDYSGYYYNNDGSFTIEVCCYLKGRVN